MHRVSCIKYDIMVSRGFIGGIAHSTSLVAAIVAVFAKEKIGINLASYGYGRCSCVNQ